MPTNGENALNTILSGHVEKPLKIPANGERGRPTREQVAFRDIVKERMERKLLKASDKVLKTYLGLAAGEVIKRGKKEYTLEVDPPTTRHAVDKLLPPAPAPLPSQVVSIQILSVDGLEIRSKAELSTDQGSSQGLEIDVVPGSSGKD